MSEQEKWTAGYVEENLLFMGCLYEGCSQKIADAHNAALEQAKQAGYAECLSHDNKALRQLFMNENQTTTAGERTQTLSGHDEIMAQPEQQSHALGWERPHERYNGKTAKEWFETYEQLQMAHTEAVANAKLRSHPLGVKPDAPVEVLSDSPQSMQSQTQ